MRHLVDRLWMTCGGRVGLGMGGGGWGVGGWGAVGLPRGLHPCHWRLLREAEAWAWRMIRTGFLGRGLS